MEDLHVLNIVCLLFSVLVDSYASNDISMKFQGHNEERKSEFHNSQISFPDLFTTHQHQSYRQLLNFITSKTNQQSISRLVKLADHTIAYFVTF